LFPGNSPDEKLLTTDEVADYLNVDVVTIRRLITKGDLASFRIGSEYRISLGDLKAYLKRQYRPANSESKTQSQEDQDDLEE
jgi:putative molybdopterin biosynthesis protein